MNDQKQALIDRLKKSNNILVTVSANPSVDQLAAAIGLTLFLNKMKKHATAVFSGQVPSTIEFLQPEDTLEKDTNSLRDFIISLDKSKADKLRYKVEENVVKIFITPYRTSLSADDLDFSQGDFNVDVVIALGVHEQHDLDQAIIAHGRILHDATVASVNVQSGAELGSINWVVNDASSLSELAVELTDTINKELLDGQIATAFLTGIVAETERFSNEKTSPETMRLSAELLTAGANQQLVSTELEKGEDTPEEPEAEPLADQPDDEPKSPKPQDGMLEITHPAEEAREETPSTEPVVIPDDQLEPVPAPEHLEAVHDVKQNTFDNPPFETPAPSHSQLPPQHYIGETPAQLGQMSDDIAPEANDDFLHDDATSHIPILGHSDDEVAEPAKPETEAEAEPAPPKVVDPSVEREEPRQPAWQPHPQTPSTMELPSPDLMGTSSVNPGFQPLESEPHDRHEPAAPSTPPANSLQPAPNTLADIEKAVHSPHSQMTAPATDAQTGQTQPDLNAAMKAVQDVYNNAPITQTSLPPNQAVGSSGYLKVQDLPGIEEDAAPAVPNPAPTVFVPEPAPGSTPAETPLTMPLPPAMPMPGNAAMPTVATPGVITPPTVPPPFLPPQQ